MKRTLLIGMILGALIGSWVLWMPVVVRAVACTPLGTNTALQGFCKPAIGELSWGTAVNGNFDALDALGYVPSGAILMIDSGSCPTNYAEVTAMRGFYPRGVLPAGETIGNTVGTALTAAENRAVGQHSHITVALTGSISAVAGSSSYQETGTAADAPTAATANAGSVAGTNAPYRLVMFCKKT